MGVAKEKADRSYFMTKQFDLYRKNAQRCMEMAEAAPNEPAHNRYKRMEAAWLALAEEQGWLDGEGPPENSGLAGRR